MTGLGQNPTTYFEGACPILPNADIGPRGRALVKLTHSAEVAADAHGRSRPWARTTLEGSGLVGSSSSRAAATSRSALRPSPAPHGVCLFGMLISLGMGRLDLDELATALEAAWANAFPGRETAERDAILREFIELLQEPAPSLDPARPRLRLITSTR
jgi:hypothetical protein